MCVIKTDGLCKYFIDKKAIENLNLEVPEGIAFGYLGPNGAGKTTTIRLLLNLAKPTSGTAYVYGEDIKRNRSYLKKIGYLPDVPNFYNFFTAKEFLKFIADITEIENPKRRIEETLELSGLKNEKKRIGSYSRGMKQRLGLAQALLPDPPLLILDEPTSSLDPQGRKEVLDLISSLKGKKTVFFSTHILNDVERVCDRVAVIKEGRILVEDTITDLKKRYVSHLLLISVDRPEDFLKKIKNFPSIVSISKRNSSEILIDYTDISLIQENIQKIILEENFLLYKWEVLEPSLEDIFLEVTSQ
jgi:ABC-2 type transport system ATP-binding protein